MPWHLVPVSSETSLIDNLLVRLNKSGFWTINSQPGVNGSPSEDPVVGWGPSGGFVYQKPYLEFFCSPEKFSQLYERLRDHPSITFHAVSNKVFFSLHSIFHFVYSKNDSLAEWFLLLLWLLLLFIDGYVCYSEKGESYQNSSGVNAVTWGVFPNREVLQPTIVDPASFVAWKVFSQPHTRILAYCRKKNPMKPFLCVLFQPHVFFNLSSLFPFRMRPSNYGREDGLISTLMDRNREIFFWIFKIRTFWWILWRITTSMVTFFPFLMDSLLIKFGPFLAHSFICPLLLLCSSRLPTHILGIL